MYSIVNEKKPLPKLKINSDSQKNILELLEVAIVEAGEVCTDSCNKWTLRNLTQNKHLAINAEQARLVLCELEKIIEKALVT